MVKNVGSRCTGALQQRRHQTGLRAGTPKEQSTAQFRPRSWRTQA